MSGKMGKETLILREAIREIETELGINLEPMRNLRSRKSCVEHLLRLINKKEENINSFSFFKKIKKYLTGR